MSVPLGFLVVPHVVMDPRTESVRFWVVSWVQFWVVNGMSAAPWFQPVVPEWWPSPDALRERSLHDRLLAEDGEVKVALSFSDYLSHTTPSPSPSLALGTIHLG